MATVLGPTAISEQKFTAWSTKCKALGLLWNTTTATVSIPTEKLVKALNRVEQLLSHKAASRSILLKTIGSLRHVPVPLFNVYKNQRREFQSTAFVCYQRQPSMIYSGFDRFYKIILGSMIYPFIHFADVSEPKFHVFMDASNNGLCALEPSLQQFIRQKFSTADSQDSSINVRELRSAVLAALHWGPYWAGAGCHSRTHVQFHIDNTSAVSWANRRSSRNPIARMYNRLLSLAEFKYNLVFTASHIPGKLNVMADAGSRAWSTRHPLAETWSNMSCAWTQIPVQEPFDNLSVVW
ncbi:Hypothetical protein PHPALM_8460, partial [Phytophthora palmivora]